MNRSEAADELELELQELPREEVLARLYELVNRYAYDMALARNVCPFSVERSELGLGLPHPFAFGCCREGVTTA